MPKPFLSVDVDGFVFKSSVLEKTIEQGIAGAEPLFDAASFDEAYAIRRQWQADNAEGTYNAYLHKLVGAFVQQMAGVEVARFEQVADAMVAEHQVRRFAFPRKLITQLSTTHYVVAISGSPTPIVERLLADLPINEVWGSEYEEEDGYFNGVARSVGDKGHIAKGLVARGLARREGSVAAGDTMSDASMMHYAEHQIMFNASRTLTDYGKVFHWPRVNEVKDQITAMQFSADHGQYIEVAPEDILCDI